VSDTSVPERIEGKMAHLAQVFRRRSAFSGGVFHIYPGYRPHFRDRGE
jgi:hypothetical protein